MCIRIYSMFLVPIVTHLCAGEACDIRLGEVASLCVQTWPTERFAYNANAAIILRDQPNNSTPSP